ncbi:hypothetical protein [Streptomyces griseosporeus]|uniref:hypothetical protein n=1 Tax=Streptomyces griseosporeus TaxID=1910 RepID=UPI0036BBCAB4
MRRSRAVLTTVTAAALAGCGGAHPPPEAGPDDRALVRADITVALDALGSGHPQVVSVPRPAARPCTVVVLLATREAPRADATARIAAVLAGRGWRQAGAPLGDERVYTRARWRLDVGAGTWPYARLLDLVADEQRPEGDTFTGVIASARREGCPAGAS